MKKFILIGLFLIYSSAVLQAQSSHQDSTEIDRSGFRMSLRGGYDFPTYKNNTPYIDYKGGLEFGLSADYYWHWFGLGIDVDYINNKPENTYPTENLFYAGNQVTDFSLEEKKITRIFYGLGPDFRLLRRSNSDLEIKLRGGFASIDGGRTELLGELPPTSLLNFHAGYSDNFVLSAKGSAQYNYFFNSNFGVFVGAYYMHHFKTKADFDSNHGISAGYVDFNNEEKVSFLDPELRAYGQEEPCKDDIYSIGAYAGVVYTFGGKKKKKEKEAPECSICGCGVSITARDKFTEEILPNTDVILTNMEGKVIDAGTTNSFGVVVFESISAGNYIVKGKLYDVDLEEVAITEDEFDNCVENGPVEKEMLYTDEAFIIDGEVVVCNTDTPIENVSVILKNVQEGIQKTTKTDKEGAYLFHAKQNKAYEIHGKKDNYMSQTETISTADFDRNKTLFIKLEICMDEVNCGEGLVLKNILYDLDKYFIREDAKPELNRLVQFMKDHEDVKVELSSHTDSRASDAYNMTLSQNRANAAVEYIVSKGIARDRLIPKGYGERKLLNECADGVPCTEEQHQLNRRTEMKVICPGEY